MSLRVRVRDGCTGMGTCARLAPALFALDPATGKARVLVDDAEPFRDQALRAAAACPFVGVVETAAESESEVEAFEEVQVSGAEHLTADILELRLHRRDLHFVPGEYLFLRLRDADGEFFRPYSIVDAAGSEVVLWIRLLANGRAGRVLAAIEPGTVVGISRPAGGFRLLTPHLPKLFVSGGTGLAPVVPMARRAAGARKTLVLGARTEADLFHLEHLRALPNLEVIAAVEQPSSGWSGITGTVLDALATVDLRRFHEAYSCGSPGMVTAVRESLARRGFAPQRIFADAFTPAAPAAAAAEVSPAPAAARPQAKRFDPLSLLRSVHYVASLAVCALIVFFAASGFVANRGDWLLGGRRPPSAAIPLPAEVGEDADAQARFCLGLVPGATSAEALAGEDGTAFLISAPGGVLARCELDPGKGTAAVQPMLPLPADCRTLDARAQIAALVAQRGGELDDQSIEEGGDRLVFESESVWRHDRWLVDRQRGIYGVASARAPLAKAISDLHRGKHAGAAQKLLMDAAALALVVVSGTGIVMGLQARRRRRSASLILGLSALSLVYLLVNR